MFWIFQNIKYYKAIRQAIKLLRDRNKEIKVLDIGTGTGLLSMMAAESGADTVTACEVPSNFSHLILKGLEIAPLNLILFSSLSSN